MRMIEVPRGGRLFSPQSLVAGLAAGLIAATAVAQAPHVEPAQVPRAAPAAPVAPPVQLPPVQPMPRGIRVLDLHGGINRETLDRLRGALESAEPGRMPAGAIVIIDSPGGDGLAAIEIGRLVRAAKAHVFVRGRCASACVYVLAAGVVRGVARDGAVGIHSPRLSTFVKGLGVVDINPGSNPRAAAAFEVANRRSREYFAEMGLPETFFSTMLATPSDRMRHLDLAELPPLGLQGFDAAYLAERAPAAARVYGVSEEEYARRTLAVAGLCLPPGAMPGGNDFVACYRRVLRTGE